MLRKIAIYFIFVLLFLIGKALFMCFHADVYGAFQLSECLLALWYGIPHDLTCAGYVMALPFVAELLHAWVDGSWHRHFMRYYLVVILVPVLLNYLFDLVLYGYWGFRMDATALFYLLDNPAEALGQATCWQWIGGIVALVALVWLLQKPLLCFYAEERNRVLWSKSIAARSVHTLLALLLCGIVFVAIRGGVTTSTMNIGRVYFSSEMPLNHAATNPLFSFFSTIGKQKRFDKQYRFMSEDEAKLAMESLNRIRIEDADGDETDSVPFLTTQRPNIVLVILEGFSGAASRVLHPEIEGPSYMPNIDRLYGEGIGFTRLYANSFRTDRGVASILASYPGQPTNSVMKDQKKCNNLQYLSKRLKEEGYNLHFIHGGDVNFTNMHGFLMSGGFTNITGDTDFPVSERLSKWGVPDHEMFDYLYNEIANMPVGKGQSPYLKVMLTLSSHEPFDVEYHHYDNPYLNSVAYTDSCLGSFVDKLKVSEAWKDLLLIFVPDHCYARYPENVQNHEPLRYHIPMVWTGGAVSGVREVNTLGQQTDLCATLFGLMGIHHEDFNFSKDMLNKTQSHYAFYSFSDGFGLLTDSCRYIQDNANNGCALSGSEDPNGTAERWGKAYLQTLYDDLQQR